MKSQIQNLNFRLEFFIFCSCITWVVVVETRRGRERETVQTDRQTDTQTDRHGERERRREKEREVEP